MVAWSWLNYLDLLHSNLFLPYLAVGSPRREAKHINKAGHLCLSRCLLEGGKD